MTDPKSRVETMHVGGQQAGDRRHELPERGFYRCGNCSLIRLMDRDVGLCWFCAEKEATRG